MSTIAIFPWSQQSLEELWDGGRNKEEFITPWKEMVLEWSGAFAVGGIGKVLVYGLKPSFKPIRIRLPAVRYWHHVFPSEFDHKICSKKIR